MERTSTFLQYPCKKIKLRILTGKDATRLHVVIILLQDKDLIFSSYSNMLAIRRDKKRKLPLERPWSLILIPLLFKSVYTFILQVKKLYLNFIHTKPTIVKSRN